MLTEDEKRKVVELYQQGYTINAITKVVPVSNVTAKKLVVNAGVYDESRRRKPTKKKSALKVLKRPAEWNMKLDKIIRQSDIDRVRKEIKVGDQLLVRTEKADGHCDDGADVSAKVTARKAIVINTGNPRFCQTRLESGAREDILWADIVIWKRSNKAYIG